MHAADTADDGTRVRASATESVPDGRPQHRVASPLSTDTLAVRCLVLKQLFAAARRLEIKGTKVIMWDLGGQGVSLAPVPYPHV